MILVTLGLSVIFFFIAVIYLKNRGLRLLLTALTFVVFLLSTVFLMLNDTKHFGMKKVVTSEKTTLYSSVQAQGANVNVLLYQPLGTTDKNSVYLYATKEGQKSLTKTKADEYTQIQVTRNTTSQATITTKKVEWVYKNQTAKLWFGVANNNHILVKRIYAFSLPKDWKHLTVKELKALQTQLAKQAQAAAMAKAKQAAAAQAAK